jgi:hypothetical protein
MRRLTLICAAAISAVVSCRVAASREAPAVDWPSYLAEHEAWRDALRAERMGYWLLLLGRWELREGTTAFGSDADLPIALPEEHAPKRAGVFTRDGASVRVEAAGRGALRLEDGTVVAGPVTLQPRDSGVARAPRDVVTGSIHLFLAESQGTFMVFAWDERHPAGQAFTMPDTFQPAPGWRVAARLERFRTPRIHQMVDVTGDIRPREAPGVLVFQYGGRSFQLLAFKAKALGVLFVPFKDTTNASETYGGGRDLSPALPGPDGWTVIDFNRAENPPCAFSAFTTCMLPPRENRLDLAVTAGEKRPNHGPTGAMR